MTALSAAPPGTTPHWNGKTPMQPGKSGAGQSERSGVAPVTGARPRKAARSGVESSGSLDRPR
eukprot:8398939-Alexandrium_andersonii.AAC.1